MLYILLFFVVALLCVCAYLLSQILDKLDVLHTDFEGLRLTGRTRQAQAVMRNTPKSPERELVKLGRQSKSQRVVVGGDPQSELYQAQQRGVEPDDVSE